MTLGNVTARERGVGWGSVFCLILMLTAGLATDVKGQQNTGRITGIVVDSLSRAPLAGVQVYLERSSLGAMTRQNGRYTITNVPAGTYQLRAERIRMTVAPRPITQVAGGRVYPARSSLGQMTRQTGRYTITTVPAGTYQLRAERFGMTLALRPITLAAGETVEANFALEVKALGLDEIVVTGTAGAAR